MKNNNSKINGLVRSGREKDKTLKQKQRQIDLQGKMLEKMLNDERNLREKFKLIFSRLEKVEIRLNAHEDNGSSWQ